MYKGIMYIFIFRHDIHTQYLHIVYISQKLKNEIVHLLHIFFYRL